MDYKRLEKIISGLGEARILVFGDLMWDEYVRGDVSRISPEAPVPVFLFQGDDKTPGGAANVLKNLKELKCAIGVLGIVGADDKGIALRQEFDKWGMAESTHLLSMPDRPTTVKTRIMARNQQLLRIDREKNVAIPENVENEILKIFEQICGQYQAVIFSDYDKGLLTKRVIEASMKIASRLKVFTAVDPQVKHFRFYSECDIMTPNEKEASEGIGFSFPKDDAELEVIARKIMAELKLAQLLITRSQRGMALFSGDNVRYVPTLAREVFDVSGAGDTVISVYTAAICVGASYEEAMILSNIAGGIVVGKLGTATVSTAELLRDLKLLSEAG